MFFDDEYELDEEDGFVDDVENNDEENEEDLENDYETEEDIDRELDLLDQEERENEEELNNFESNDPDERDAQTDKFLGKQREIDKKRKNLEEKQDEIKKNKEKKKKEQMKAEAHDKFSVHVPKYICPRCKKKTLFTEPAFPWGAKALACYVISLTGVVIQYKPHFACYNPECKSYYLRTGDLFAVNDIGELKKMPTKNPFYISRK